MALNLEKLYANACENLRAVCWFDRESNDDAEKLYRMLTTDTATWLRCKYIPNILPALEIWNDAHEELYKSKGGSAYSALKKIIKGVGGSRANLAGAWLDPYGHQCVCDGYRAVRLVSPVEGLKEAVGMDLTPVFPASLYGWEEMPLPSPGELKVCIAEQKGKGKKLYDFGEGLPLVNAEYLKDVLDILPDAVAYRDPSSPNKPVVFVSDKGDALLLPIHKSAA